MYVCMCFAWVCVCAHVCKTLYGPYRPNGTFFSCYVRFIVEEWEIKEEKEMLVIKIKLGRRGRLVRQKHRRSNSGKIVNMEVDEN